jgi:hypothetical protein
LYSLLSNLIALLKARGCHVMKIESQRAIALSIKTYADALIGVISFFIIVMHVLEVPIGGEEPLTNL